MDLCQRVLPPGARFTAPGAVVRTVVTYDDGTQIIIVSDAEGGEQTTCSRAMEQGPDGTWRVVRR